MTLAAIPLALAGDQVQLTAQGETEDRFDWRLVVGICFQMGDSEVVLRAGGRGHNDKITNGQLVNRPENGGATIRAVQMAGNHSVAQCAWLFARRIPGDIVDLLGDIHRAVLIASHCFDHGIDRKRGDLQPNRRLAGD